MSLIFYDGFQDCTSMIKSKWLAGGAFGGVQTGRDGVANGAAGTIWSSDGVSGTTVTLSPSLPMITWGIALKPNFPATFGLNVGTFGQLYIGTTAQLWVRANAGGFLELVRNGNTVLGTSSGHSPLVLGAWNYVEVQAVLATSGATAKVRLNGVLVINFTGQTSAATGNITGLAFPNGNSNNATHIDDLYILDGVDATTPQGRPNNDFLGDIRVQTLFPSAAGDTTQWTPSAGTNWGSVDENPVNTSDYVSDSVSGHRDLYNMTDMTGAVGTVYAIQSHYYASKSDAGGALLKPAIKENSVVTVESGQALSFGSWGILSSAIYCQKPSGPALWTAADINALQVGQDVA